MTGPSGFMYGAVRVYYVDALGKDAGIDRWRADLYYQTHLAKTALFSNELAYEVFLAANRPLCYPTYGRFREAHGSRW